MSKTAEIHNVAARAEMGLCSGCGVCSTVCDAHCLTMKFNVYGELVPILTGICRNCSACLNVCPFVDGNPDEDHHGKALFSGIEGITRSKEAGFYHQCFVGYAPDDRIRWNGASGGMLTWLLCELLGSGKVDYIISVNRESGGERLYSFRVMSTPEEVKECSKSAYYPVELSSGIESVLKNKGRYAVVGLPCACKAIRNAQMYNSELAERIIYVLGLVCAGHQVNKYYAEAIAHIAGLNGALEAVEFRKKRMGQPMTNHITALRTVSGESRTIAYFDGPKDLWSSRAFALRGCRYCDDAFAECADAAFMDAWFGDYPRDSRGVSVVLSRRAELSVILNRVSTLATIDMADVVGSQAVVEKRQALQARLLLARLLGYPVHKTRESPSLFSVKGFIKTMHSDARAWAARKNLSAGRAYDEFRLSLLPVIVADIIFSAGRRLRDMKLIKRTEQACEN